MGQSQTVRKDFDSYKFWYYSGHPYEALVYCYQGGQYVGRIVFFPDDAVPTNQNYASGPSIHFGMGKFDSILHILQTEKPLYLFLNLSNNIGTLATGDFEPVGEQEGH